MRKKVVSWVLTFAMLLSTLGAFPLTAAADDTLVCQVGATQYSTLDAGLTAVAGGGTIVLLDNINFANTIIANGVEITIDLNGYALTVKGVAGHALQALNNGILNIYDVDGDGGALTVNSSGAYKSCAYASSGGDINITGTLTAAYPGSGDNQGIYALFSDGTYDGNDENDGSITLTGNATGYTAGACAQHGATITVVGDVEGGYYGAYSAYGALLNITGDVTAGTNGLAVEYGGIAKVRGDITGGYGLYINNISGWNAPDVDVIGNVIGTGAAAITASNDADIDIVGNVIAENGYGVIFSDAGDIDISGNITAKDGVNVLYCSGFVTVGGDIISDSGIGINIDHGGDVTVEGEITGASTYIKLNDTGFVAADGVPTGGYNVYQAVVDTTYSTARVKIVLPAVCRVGETEYSSLDDGIAAANGDTITLLADINYNKQLAVSSYIDLNLNGHTLNVVNGSGTGTAGAGLYTSGQDLDISGEGELNVTGTTYGVYVVGGGSADVTNATATTDGGIAVFVQTDGTSACSVTVYGDATADSPDSIGVLASNMNSRVIVCGDISASDTEGTGVKVLNGGTVTVRGYIEATKYINMQDAIINQDNYSTIIDNYYIYIGGDNRVEARQEVCTLNGTPYLFLEDAFEAAGDGDTLTLLTNIRSLSAISLTGIDLLLDLDSYTLETGVAAGDTPSITVDGGSLSIDESGGGKLNVITGVTGVKVRNGATAEVSSITNVHFGVDADGTGCFVTVNGSVASPVNSGTGLVLKNGAGAYVKGDLTGYNGVDITGDSVTVTVDGTITATGGMGVRVISGGDVTVNGDINSDSYGVYAHGASASGEVDIYGDVTSTGSIGTGVWYGADVTIHGNVSSKAGIQAREAGAVLTVTGDVTATDSYYYGAWADGGSLITVDGSFTAASDDMFIYIENTVKTEAEGVLDGRYTVYTDGESAVRLKGLEFFKEDFEDGTMAGWAQSGTGWSVTNTLSSPETTAHSGSYAAKFNSYSLGSGITSLLYQTESLNLSKGTDYWLEFWMYHDSSWVGSDDHIVVQISINGGGWVDLGTFHRYSVTSGWVKEAIDLSAYAGQSDVRIAFLGVSANGHNMFIDDITVSHECIIDGCTTTEAYGGFTSSKEIEGETYYCVTTPEQLAHINEHMSLNFIQTADIDLASYNGGKWVPIGGFGNPSDYSNPVEFTGKYFGDDHLIDNLYCFYDGEQNAIHAGIFAALRGTSATVRDLTVKVKGIDITNYNYTYFGGVSARMDGGTISNCHVVFEGDVVTDEIDGTPNGYAGGIVGSAYPIHDSDSGSYQGMIENCDVTFETGSILTDGWSKYAGGIVGRGAISVIGCNVIINAGEKIKAPIVGGIIGSAEKMKMLGSRIENCTVTGDGTLELFSQKYYSAAIGGIAGSAGDGDIRNCDNAVELTAALSKLNDGEAAYAGGIVGYAGSNTSVFGCDNAGDLTLSVVNAMDDEVDPTGKEYAYAGGIVGFVNGYSRACSIENCQNNANVKSVNEITYSRAYAGGIVGHMDSKDEENNGVTIKNCANIGSDKTVETYAATTMTGGIAGSSTYAAFETPNIILENCYNLSSVYSESNGAVDPESMCTGLTAGGIIGAAGKMTVTACYSTAPDVNAVNNYEGDAYVGGVVGLLYGTALSQNYCESNANVTNAAGGIVNGMQITAQSDVPGNYQCTTAQNLKTKSFFGTAWKWYTSGGTAPDYYSASAPWRMTSATSYPALRGTAYTTSTPPSGGGGGSALITYTITATAGAGGSISPSGSVTVEKLASKTFTVTAAAGYKIADVKVDGKSVGAVSSYTFDAVAAKHTIEAKFEKMSEIEKFSDVNPELWYAEGIQFVLSRGLFKGITDTTFEPDTAMTRAMLVTVLHRLAGNPNAGISELFADVEEGSWFDEAVRWASGKGVVKGYDNSTFGPGISLTREQLAVILFRYADLSGYDTTARADLTVYGDAAEVSSWAEDAMRWAVAEGLITGTAGDTLDAGGAAGRAQVATILMRFVQTFGK